MVNTKIGMEIMKFLSKNIKLEANGQGNITLGSDELWLMNDEELLKKFSNFCDKDIETLIKSNEVYK